MDALTTESIIKSFDGVCAVQELSWPCPPAPSMASWGRTGGKTTALRMVMNIIYPDSGAIRVLGQETLGRAKDRVGYMPEERGSIPA